ncbi:PREDICTED: probable basic-leucine zipper transcription factor Q [Nelumbo nucifera]|uniref:Probable basic-leucine zipper transcription factor Q n=1 Tax=Nelumbo nucifera TaxID=4432 RepID=A0A1U8AUX3_NELNU|nr:PREDICTED: probable basic-leucine zipper transcription factor Q [Nelumbo nucifera]
MASSGNAGRSTDLNVFGGQLQVPTVCIGQFTIPLSVDGVPTLNVPQVIAPVSAPLPFAIGMTFAKPSGIPPVTGLNQLDDPVHCMRAMQAQMQQVQQLQLYQQQVLHHVYQQQYQQQFPPLPQNQQPVPPQHPAAQQTKPRRRSERPPRRGETSQVQNRGRRERQITPPTLQQVGRSGGTQPSRPPSPQPSQFEIRLAENRFGALVADSRQGPSVHSRFRQQFEQLPVRIVPDNTEVSSTNAEPVKKQQRRRRRARRATV